MSGRDSPDEKDSATHHVPTSRPDYEHSQQPTLAFEGYSLPMRPTYGPVHQHPPQHYYHHPHAPWGYSYPAGAYTPSNLSYSSNLGLVLPQITSFSPENASSGGHKLYIWLQSEKDLFAQPQINYSVMFRNKRSPAELQKIGMRDQFYQYALIAEVPMLDYFSDEYSQPYQVPLCLDMEDLNGQKLGLFRFGNFTYDDSSDVSGSGHSQEGSRKRKREQTHHEGDVVSPPPRTQSMEYLYPTHPMYAPFQSGMGGTAGMGPGGTQQPNYSYSYIQPVSGSMSYHGDPYAAVSPQYNSTAVHSQSPTPASTNSSLPVRTAQSRQRSRSPGGHLRVAMERTSSVPVARVKSSRMTSPRTSSLPTSSAASNPPLVRTSTMSQPSSSVSASRSSPEFNPYSLYPTKVTLEFEGDLESMLEDWSDEEKQARRRLVQFERHQTGSVLKVSFKGVKQEERTPNSICVSCIWWEGRREAFVTSVDTLNLLQSLIGARFTVEEKNRTRRNLEGFRPLTVAKSKAESADFFRLIMNYTNPKPRNIEKDVKVFPWKVLSLALKKVIAKYSPDYASTAGVLTQSSSSIATSRSSNPEYDVETSPDPESLSGSSENGSEGAVVAVNPTDAAAHPTVAVGSNSSYLPPGANIPPYLHQRSQLALQQGEGSQEFSHQSWEFGAYFDTSPGLTATPSTAAAQYEPQIPGFSEIPGQEFPSRNYETSDRKLN